MTKTFKTDPDTLEDTTHVKRYGNNIRKLQALKKVKERRKKRKEAHDRFNTLLE